MDKPGSLFDAYYYQHNCGIPYERNERWQSLFNNIAQRIQEEIQPGSVLDAGCAMGFLVESLRARGIEADGIDISEYAIQHAHESIKSYVSVGLVTEPFAHRYDLIVCIEVLEHMSKDEADKAIANLCQYSDDILFSSSPFDYKEETHTNVQPPDYWIEQFARYGFIRDLDFDATFITPWTVRLRKRSEPLHRIVREYDRNLWTCKKENYDLRLLAQEKHKEIVIDEQRIAELETRNHELENRWAELEKSTAWHMVRWMQALRLKLVPPNSSRARWLNKIIH